MRLGIVGTGKIVEDLMQGRSDLPLLETYLCSSVRSGKKAERLCLDYNLQGVVTDYDELLDKDIDTVYVALPNHIHFMYAKKALEARKNVILEKPAVPTAMEWKELVDLAGKNDCMIIEAMNIHFLPGFINLKGALPKLGQVKIASFNYSQYSSRYDAFRKGEIQPAFDYHMAGGALMDINVYNINAVVALFGKPDSINYSANVAKGIDTSGILTLDYNTFKVVCIGAKDCAAPLISTIQGEDGSICIKESINHIEDFELNSKNNSEIINGKMEKHRLVYEFVEFEKIFNEKDIERVSKLNELTGTVVEIMEEARRQAGIDFSAK